MSTTIHAYIYLGSVRNTILSLVLTNYLLFESLLHNKIQILTSIAKLNMAPQEFTDIPPLRHRVGDDGNVHDFTGTTESIENSHIVTNTRNTYNCSLTDFILYLYVNLKHKLVSSEELDLAVAQDALRGTPKQRAAKKFIRNECLRQLILMNRTENNSPIHLSGPSAIVYEDIVNYMGTKRKVVEVDQYLADILLAEEGAEVVNSIGGSKIKVCVRLSDSSYSAIQSGILILYRQSGMERTVDIKEGMSMYCKGSKRKGRQLKQSLGLAISEGKKPMSR